MRRGKNLQKHLRTLKQGDFVYQAAMLQQRSGRAWLVGHPRGSRLWSWGPIRRLLRQKGVFTCEEQSAVAETEEKSFAPFSWMSNVPDLLVPFSSPFEEGDNAFWLESIPNTPTSQFGSQRLTFGPAAVSD